MISMQRRWLRPAHTYLTRQMVSFLDGEIEVDVEIDEDAGYTAIAVLSGIRAS